jgi:hypothetical protein
MLNKKTVLAYQKALVKPNNRNYYYLVGQEFCQRKEIAYIINKTVLKYYTNYDNYCIQEIDKLSKEQYFRFAKNFVIDMLTTYPNKIQYLSNELFLQNLYQKVAFAAKSGCDIASKNHFSKETGLPKYFFHILRNTKEAGFLGYINNYDAKIVAAYSRISYKTILRLQHNLQDIDTKPVKMSWRLQSVLCQLDFSEQEFFTTWFYANGIANWKLARDFQMEISKVKELKFKQAMKIRECTINLQYSSQFAYLGLDPVPRIEEIA